MHNGQPADIPRDFPRIRNGCAARRNCFMGKKNSGGQSAAELKKELFAGYRCPKAGVCPNAEECIKKSHGVSESFVWSDGTPVSTGEAMSRKSVCCFIASRTPGYNFAHILLARDIVCCLIAAASAVYFIAVFIACVMAHKIGTAPKEAMIFACAAAIPFAAADILAYIKMSRLAVKGIASMRKEERAYFIRTAHDDRSGRVDEACIDGNGKCILAGTCGLENKTRYEKYAETWFCNNAEILLEEAERLAAQTGGIAGAQQAAENAEKALSDEKHAALMNAGDLIEILSVRKEKEFGGLKKTAADIGKFVSSRKYGASVLGPQFGVYASAVMDAMKLWDECAGSQDTRKICAAQIEKLTQSFGEWFCSVKQNADSDAARGLVSAVGALDISMQRDLVLREKLRKQAEAKEKREAAETAEKIASGGGTQAESQGE